jgi:hypothetical protein
VSRARACLLGQRTGGEPRRRAVVVGFGKPASDAAGGRRGTASLLHRVAYWGPRLIEACLAIDMVVAWRIFHLCKLGRETPNVACTVFFEECEWKALVCHTRHDPTPPAKPPTLREATRMVAALGGFLGRRSDGEPGTESLWIGLQRLDDLAAMWKSVVSRLCATSIGNPRVQQPRIWVNVRGKPGALTSTTYRLCLTHFPRTRPVRSGITPVQARGTQVAH